MSRDFTIYKTNPDTSKISLPLLYVNPQFGFSVNSILRHIHGSPDVFLKPNIFPYEIKEYYWIQEGDFGSNPWLALGLLEEELYFYYKAQAYTSFDKDGNRADYYSLSSTVQGAPGMKQAYRFSTTVFDFSNDPTGYLQFENYINP